MKFKNLGFIALAFFALLLTACDDAQPETSNVDDTPVVEDAIIEDDKGDEAENNDGDLVIEDEDIEDAVEYATEFTGFVQFVTIPLGTTIEEAEETLGNPTSTLTMDVLGSESTTMSWWNLNLFGISTSETVTFTDGIATSVLGTSDESNSTITSEDFGQISSGMTEAEVYDILGMPNSVMVSEFMGSISVTVTWMNPDFSSATITFDNGTVSSTMQFDL